MSSTARRVQDARHPVSTHFIASPDAVQVGYSAYTSIAYTSTV